MNDWTLCGFISSTCIDEMADYPVYVWHSDNEEEIYNGRMDEIPDDILEMHFDCWEFDPMTATIGFNVTD